MSSIQLDMYGVIQLGHVLEPGKHLVCHIIDMPQLHPDNPYYDVQCDLECLNEVYVNEQGCSMCICNENVFNGIPSDCGVSWFDGCNT